MMLSNKLNRFVMGLFLLVINVPSHAGLKENIVWQGGYDYVAIVPTEGKSKHVSSHPTELSPQEIYNLLGSIGLSEKKSSFFNRGFFTSDTDDSKQQEYAFEGRDNVSFNALFNSSELYKISVPISKSFANLKPNEDIVFSISGQHKGSFGKSNKSTTARLFYSDHKLHIIFGEIFVDIKKKYLRMGHSSDVSSKVEDSDLIHFRLKVGSRTKESDLSTALLIDKIHTLNVRKNKQRNDWLVIDMEAAKAATKQQEIDKERNNSNVVETSDLQSQTQKLAEEQQALKRKIDRLEQENKPKQTSSLEQRLSQLKQLHAKGIISDEIYNEKMRELLKEL